MSYLMQFLSVRESESSSFGCFCLSISHKATLKWRPGHQSSQRWTGAGESTSKWIHSCGCQQASIPHQMVLSMGYLSVCKMQKLDSPRMSNLEQKKKKESERTCKMETFGIPEVASHHVQSFLSYAIGLTDNS